MDILGVCPKCKKKIDNNEQVSWKCAACGKEFKISFSKLHSLALQKQKNNKTSVLKCPSCGGELDSGNEEIVWKCPECGNRVLGNLIEFMEKINKGTNIPNNKTMKKTKRKDSLIKNVLYVIGMGCTTLSGFLLLGSIIEGDGNLIAMAVLMLIGLLFIWQAEVIKILEEIREKL